MLRLTISWIRINQDARSVNFCGAFEGVFDVFKEEDLEFIEVLHSESSLISLNHRLEQEPHLVPDPVLFVSEHFLEVFHEISLLEVL